MADRSAVRPVGFLTCLIVALFTPVGARAQSALDGFNPGANGVVYALAMQSDGKILVGGAFSTIGGGGNGATPRSHLARLSPDGSVDQAFNPGADNTVYTITVQADGKILVGGEFTMLGGGTGTTARDHVGRLLADGSIDTTFNPGANGRVSTIALQLDGKILVGGSFTTLGGGIGTMMNRNSLGRINADGSIDTSFDPGADASVHALTIQSNGQILAGGDFTMLGGGGTGATPRARVGRLNADGSLDTTFDPGTNSSVNTVTVQADGKIIVGGVFSMLGGGGSGSTPRNYIGRLNAGGSIDASFNPGADNIVDTAVMQADGKILVGGLFGGLGGGTGTTTRSRIGRLNADGSVDSFNPGADIRIEELVVQPDGKILVGGDFTALGGATGTTTRNYIGRLYGDGSVDTDFNPGADGPVYTLAVQPDGKILVGGGFSDLGGGTTRNGIGRLNADGSLDNSFDPGANNVVHALALQPDGKILVGGRFTTLARIIHE